MHGNLAALQAVLVDVHRAGFTRGAITGDLVTRGLHPEEVVHAVRALGWPCVEGNTDRRLVDTPRLADHRKARRAGGRHWTRLRVSNASLSFLAELPGTCTLRVGDARVLVAHEGPDGPGRLLGDDPSPATVAAQAERHGVDALVVGHTHRPLLVRADGALLMNPGSVGEGTPEDRRPSWGWLAWEGGRLTAGLERVERPLAAVRQQPPGGGEG